METNAERNPNRPRFLILGTAGHIDHGKTSLVKALTGTDTDRLPEEKRRGMTIELGFAMLNIGDMTFGVVDVPGHERFVRTMVAGATGIDVALIVVAGDDSVMPQTVEHIEILRLVGVTNAVIAITKIDSVDKSLVDIVVEDVRDLLKETELQSSPIVRVSSVTGEGLEELTRTLQESAEHVPIRKTGSSFRMAIDRVFTVKGRGTVVTGSVLQGTVKPGDMLELHPGSSICRVRETHSHGIAQEEVQIGRRAAINLIGLDKRDIERGHELSTPNLVTPTRRIDVSFETLKSCSRSIKPFSRLRICMGTREIIASVVPLSGKKIDQGTTDYAQLRSAEGFFAVYGQRFIAREENDSRTIGGGIVLRPAAHRWLADRENERRALDTLNNGSPSQRLTQVSVEAGFARLSDLQLSASTAIDPGSISDIRDQLISQDKWLTLDGFDRRIPPDCIKTLFDRAERRIERYHRDHPDEPGHHVDSFIGWLERKSAAGLGRELLGLYIQQTGAQLHGKFVCAPAFAPKMSQQDKLILDGLLKLSRESGFAPRPFDVMATDLDTDIKRVRRLAKIAISYGELIEIDKTICLSAENEQRLRDEVANMIRDNGDVTVAQVRERLDSSRKYTVPFMEYLDRIRFTVRKGDKRVLYETKTQ